MHTLFNKYPSLIYMVMAILCIQLAMNWATPKEPVEVLGYDVETAVAFVNEPVNITFQLDRRRICNTNTTSWWEDSNGKEIMRLPVRARSSYTLGVTEASISIPAPPIPGNMCYQSRSYHTCQDGAFTVHTPKICMRIFPQQH